jgi:hypothetical protein
MTVQDEAYFGNMQSVGDALSAAMAEGKELKAQPGKGATIALSAMVRRITRTR